MVSKKCLALEMHERERERERERNLNHFKFQFMLQLSCFKQNLDPSRVIIVSKQRTVHV